MFHDKRYYEVNREERFFCFLFAHALLASEQVKAGFVSVVESKWGLPLNPLDLEIYVEAAVLRDYWHSLGDPVVYDEETHARRRAVLAIILDEFGLPDSIIDEHDFFWTPPHRSKLWSPGRWNSQAMQRAGLDNLLRVKWAFNAKPDIMIVSGKSVLMIEAKVESGEGRHGESGYEQYDIQRLVSRLLQRTAPQFSDATFRNIELGLSSRSGLSWQEVIALVEPADIDAFSKKCLLQLRRFRK